MANKVVIGTRFKIMGKFPGEGRYEFDTEEKDIEKIVVEVKKQAAEGRFEIRSMNIIPKI